MTSEATISFLASTLLHKSSCVRFYLTMEQKEESVKSKAF
jgi:hypothetical protein